VETIPCHRVILAGASSHFATVLSSNFEEGKTQRIVVEADEAEAFKMFLTSVYGKLCIPEGDHAGILKVAQLYDKYTVASGVANITESMRENTLMATYLAVVPAFAQIAMDILCTQFLMIFFPNGEEVCQPAVSLLNYDTMLKLVQSDAVVLRTEQQMLRVVLAWLEPRTISTSTPGTDSPSGDAQGQEGCAPDALLLEQAGALLGGIRAELLSVHDLEAFQALPWLNHPPISEALKDKLLSGYRHRANVAEGRFRSFRSRQHILYDRTFAPWEKLFFGDCPETDLAGVRFCVSFDYRDGKFGAFLKFQHKFDASIPIRFTVHLPSTNKCCERKFRPMFDFRWGWRCIDNDLLFEHRAAPIRLYCVVAFSDKLTAPDAVA
jgi:hypothetical protein